MNAHAEKNPENKNRSLADQSLQKQSKAVPEFGFYGDNRQVSQLKALRETANNSLQSRQVAQMQAMANQYADSQEYPVQKKENTTGLPDNLKSGVENISGHSLDDVKVHYHSPKPAQLQAHAYAQGTDIHVASGQEKHLPHEAWHVVQQKQGRVKPTMQMKGTVNVNDDAGLEKEADVMGAKALETPVQLKTAEPVQMVEYKSAEVTKKVDNWNPNNEKWPGTDGPVGIWTDSGAIKGTDVTVAGSKLCRDVEQVTAALGVKQEMGSPHMAPKRMGGKGDASNVRPWKSEFENDNWHGTLDRQVNAEFLKLKKNDVFYEHVETVENQSATNAWLKPLQDKQSASADNEDKTKLADYLTEIKGTLKNVPDGAKITTPGGVYTAVGNTFDPAPIDMVKAKAALAAFNGGDLDNVKPAAPDPVVPAPLPVAKA